MSYDGQIPNKFKIWRSKQQRKYQKVIRIRRTNETNYETFIFDTNFLRLNYKLDTTSRSVFVSDNFQIKAKYMYIITLSALAIINQLLS